MLRYPLHKKEHKQGITFITSNLKHLHQMSLNTNSKLCALLQTEDMAGQK